MSRARVVFMCVLLVAVVFVGRHWLGDSDHADLPAGAVSEKADRASMGPLPHSGAALSSAGPASSRPTGIPGQGEPKWTSLRENMSWDSTGLEVVTHTDGRKSIRTGGRFTLMAAGVRDASGKLVIQCFGDYTAMDDALSGRSVPVHTPSSTEVLDYEVSDY